MRDWARIRTLYHPDAAWHFPVVQTECGKVIVRNRTFDEYAAATQAHFDENGFYERTINRRIERFGHMAHAWLTLAYY